MSNPNNPSAGQNPNQQGKQGQFDPNKDKQQGRQDQQGQNDPQNRDKKSGY